MHPIVAIAATLVVAAITPGPNNFIVMRAASERLRDAVPAIGAILLGSLLVLAIAGAGLGTLLTSVPALRDAVTLIGALYLAWLGLRLVLPRDGESTSDALPQRWPALVAFQLANPKGWVMMLTLVAALPDDSPLHWLRLVPLVLAIPAICLLVWAAGGRLLGRLLRNETARRRLDRGFGLALMISAYALLPF